MSEAVKSAVRVLRVIDVVASSKSGLTFAQLCGSLSLPKSSAYGLLKTMTDGGYLVLGADRHYRLGIRVWEAGEAYTRMFDLPTAAKPFLVAARDALNETVQLAVLDGHENVYVAKEDSDHRLMLVSHVGGRLPAYATALGKVLLAGLPEDELGCRFLGVRLERFTPSTITTRARLADELATIRKDGYATDNAEYTPGVHCIAVAVSDHTGATVAAMSVSVPAVRNDPRTRKRILGVLRAEAAGLSKQLGYCPDGS